MTKRHQKNWRSFFLEGSKFKTDLYAAVFRLPSCRENATKTALLAQLFLLGCKRYPSVQALERKAEEMYGALWDISVVQKGAETLLILSAQTLRCVSKQEVISFLREIWLSPLVQEEAFKQEQVEAAKEKLLQRLALLQDDKRYAAKKSCMELLEGTPMAVCADGYPQDLDKIDGRGLYAYYQEVKERAQLLTFFCGEESEKQTAAELAKALCQEQKEMYSYDTQIKMQPQEVKYGKAEEKIAQSRMAMLFWLQAGTDYETEAANRCAVTMLGGSGDSMLFQTIREEKGLCYYVGAKMIPMANCMLAEAGIAAQDAERAQKETENTVRQLAEEKPSYTKLRQTKSMLLRQLEDAQEEQFSCLDMMVEDVLLGRSAEVQDRKRAIRKVNAAAVKRAAKQMRLSAVYLLCGQEAEQ